jgi:hypothetical protein
MCNEIRFFVERASQPALFGWSSPSPNGENGNHFEQAGKLAPRKAPILPRRGEIASCRRKSPFLFRPFWLTISGELQGRIPISHENP